MTRPEQAVEPISRTTLSEEVTKRLRDGILSGEFTQGGQLNEAELARRFGVSRGPLREAMQRLIQEGLLHSRPHRGVFVPELTDEDLVDIYFAREAIETAALRRIMASGAVVSISRLLTTEVDRMVEGLQRNDWNTVIDHDLRFHTHLVSAAKSRRLSRMYSPLIAETRMCLHMLASGFAERKDFVEVHVALVERLAAEDASGAEGAIRRNLHEPLEGLCGQQQGTAGPSTPPSPE